MMHLTDGALVQRVIAGRRDDYGELVRRHQDLLYRHARGMGLDHDTSIDIVQDAFVKAYTRLWECRDPAQFRAWVCRIARNLCLDYLKNIRRSTIPLSAVPEAADIHATDQGDVELAGTLQRALLSLPVAMREAFLLKHDAEYTYEEVAELTNASVSAVKMRVHRARESLRVYLQEQGVNAA
jgi:RNA polymerase sigma-70 factor (ECF subfamily)